MKKLTLGFLALLCASALAEVQLHANGTIINGISGGNPTSVVNAPNNLFGYGAQVDQANRLGDDFEPDSDWRVQSLRFYAYQTSATSFTFTTANIEIREGQNINTATTVYVDQGLAVSNHGFVAYRVDSNSTGSISRPIYRIGVSIPDLVLNAGRRYWVIWSLDGSLASGPFVPQVMDGALPLPGNGHQSEQTLPFAPVSWGDDPNNTSELPFEVWGTPSIAGYANKLIACDSTRAVYTINPLTGAKSQIGTLSSNVSTAAGLAYDRQTATLYVTSTSNDSLYRVNLADLSATLVGPFGDTNIVMHGLEFDNRAGKLYGASQHNGGLYEINTQNGQATLLGTTGLTSFLNLVDIGNSRMYCTSSGSDSFYSIDTNNGLTHLIGTLSGPTNPNGLAFDSLRNQIYLVDNSTDTFYSVNRATGVANAIGATGAGNLLGLAFLGSKFEVIVRRGENFEGDEVSLHAIDGDRYSLFNDPVSLAAVLDVNSYGHETDVARVTVRFMSFVARPGLAVSVRIRNASTGLYDFLVGGVALTIERLASVVLESRSYVDPGGAVGLRFTWAPINDEDATQDGWLHSLEYVSVQAE